MAERGSNHISPHTSLRTSQNILPGFTVVYNDSLNDETQYVTRRDKTLQGLFIY
jgi:hypothetical protein